MPEKRISELAAGDEACLEPLRNMNLDGTAKPWTCVVEKTGRKWLHVRTKDSRFTMRFDRETGEGAKENGMSPNWRLWPSKKAYAEEIERRELVRKLEKVFSWPNEAEGIPLESLREIMKIVEGASE